MTTTRLPRQKCPDCSKSIDAATATSLDDSRSPRPGDIALCCHCGAILVYDARLRSRAATLTDLMSLTPEENAVVDRASKVLRQVWLTHGRGRRP
jgi:hypothetical protein